MRLQNWLSGAAKPMTLNGAGHERRSCVLLWRRTPGMARGTAEHILTTALRWDQPKTMNAKSTPSRRLGRSFPGQQTQHALNRQWTRFKNDWFVSATN